MKIALVTHVLRPNDGQGRVNYEIAKAALEAGHNMFLVAAEIAPELEKHPNVTWIKISYGILPTNLIRYQVFAARSWLWLRKHRRELDIIHVNGAVTWAAGDVNTAHFIHTGWARSPYYAPGTGATGLYQRVYTLMNSLLERLSFRSARVVVAISSKIADELLQAGAEPSKVIIVLNGVDVTEFHEGEEDREPLGLPKGVMLALFAGDIKTYRKNLDSVLRAVSRISDLHLAVVGNPRGSPFPKMAEVLGLQARVHFLGLRRDMADLMRAADLFVFPSRYEPWGLVVTEALASGCPVVTARSTGASEVVRRGGLVIEDPEDLEALHNAIQRLVSDEDLRKEMSSDAPLDIMGLHWTDMVGKYLKLYAEYSGG